MSDHAFLRPITLDEPYRLCFVCLGNICRSPTAEGIFIHKVRQAGLASYFFIDSAGTAAYHTGEPANSKSQAVANGRGVHLPSTARRFIGSDFADFDLVLAMDSENRQDLESLLRDIRGEDLHGHKIRLMREFDPAPADRIRDRNVPDPYYGGLQGFHDVFDILDRSCEALLGLLRRHVVVDGADPADRSDGATDGADGAGGA